MSSEYSRVFEGEVYRGEFFTKPNLSDAEVTVGYGIVEPPIDPQACEDLIDMHNVGALEVRPYATTISRSVLVLVMNNYSEMKGTITEFTNDEIIERMERTIGEIVEKLNKIEDGSFLR